MLIQKAKATIKANPGAYRALLPCVQLVRQSKYRLCGFARERFRQYCSELPDFVPEPFFVKVGANDGVTGDPCSDMLIADRKWKGLLIEPVPYCFDRLKANFGDSERFSLEQVAIGARPGEQPFYYVDEAASDVIPNLPPWFDQLGSFDKAHIAEQLNGVLTPFIIESTIQVATLADVLDRRGIRDVHLLHIDTEGYDYEVLKTVDLESHAPLVIYIEHKHLSSAEKKEMRLLLRKHGYSMRNCGDDYFATNEDAEARLRSAARARRS